MQNSISLSLYACEWVNSEYPRTFNSMPRISMEFNAIDLIKKKKCHALIKYILNKFNINQQIPTGHHISNYKVKYLKFLHSTVQWITAEAAMNWRHIILMKNLVLKIFYDVFCIVVFVWLKYD